MKQIVYIGYFGGDQLKTRELDSYNLAGTLKMTFIIQCLKKLGYKVLVVSLATDKTSGYHPEETVTIDEQESHIYLPYFGVKIGKRVRGTQSVILYLAKYLKNHLTENSTVISYHSLGYGQIITKLHQKIGFRWCPQIEEIYCLSRGEYKNSKQLKNEEKLFCDGDAFLFVNDLLSEKYANGKPSAVSYGNYQVFSEYTKPSTEIINLAYTGIINSDRGVFLLLDAMRLLPENYCLNVLGFGTDSNMQKFFTKVESLNKTFGSERIKFWGTRKGKEYSEFLINNHIGISLMDENEDISANAFPSKIMAYLGHSLYVVASRTESIQKSKVAEMLYYCDNTPKSIAETILSVPVGQKNNTAEELRKLEEIFIGDLAKVIGY